MTRILLFAFSLALAAQPVLFPIRVGRQSGFIDRTGRVVIPPRFDQAEEFQEDRAVVWIGSQAGYINTAGELVIPAIYTTAKAFTDGRALVSRDGKYSVIDRTGKTVAEIPYRVLGDYSDGLAVVQRARSGSIPAAYGYIDREGRVAIPPRFMPAGKFPGDGQGVAVGGLDRNWCYFDKRGQIVLRLPMDGHDRAPGFHDGLVVWKEGFFWGYRNAKGEWAIRPEFDDAHDFSNGVAQVEKDGKWMEIDTRGKPMPARTGPQPIRPPSEGLTLAVDGDRYGYLLPDGRPAFPFRKMDAAFDFTCGLARIQLDGKFGYLDKEGRLAISNEFFAATDFRGCLAMVQSREGWQYVNPKGQVVWKPEARF
ncbi:MAG TPA: WG repeat-containing protein [Bryobacteraceae bacterium]|nr:WG repeat-containing protein [Bryobacteraceae bacterium]